MVPLVSRARSTTPRRTFVARVTGVIAAWPLLGRIRGLRAMAAAASPPRLRPNATILDALGDAVLPAELGADGVSRAVVEFQRWMDGYRPGAEANHGYGTGKIEHLPADPRPRWRSQLAALDADARRNGPSFSASPRSFWSAARTSAW